VARSVDLAHLQNTISTKQHNMQSNEQWEEPCAERGQFVAQMRSSPNYSFGPGNNILARRHAVRPDFKLDSKFGMDSGRLQMSSGIDALAALLTPMHFNMSRILNILVVAWWAIRQHDPATPSYVQTAIELKHALCNLMNAVDSVVLWMTGGCAVKPIFKLKPCKTFQQWSDDIFKSTSCRPNTFMPLHVVLEQLRAHTDNINTQIPYIFLEMQHIREEHGNDVGFLMSPDQVQRYGPGKGGWMERCDMSRSMDLLRNSLGMRGPNNPVPWAMAHLVHFLKETIHLVQREWPNAGYTASETDE